MYRSAVTYGVSYPLLVFSSTVTFFVAPSQCFLNCYDCLWFYRRIVVYGASLIKMVDVVGFEPTTFRVRAEYSDPVELHIHKKLYLILSTNYNHLTTLYCSVNNFLKKWWLRSDLNWQHEVLQTSALHWSYWANKVIDKSKESNLFGSECLILYHALRTSTCQKLICMVGIEPTACA